MSKKKQVIQPPEEDVVLITQAGYDELVRELDHRINAQRPEIAQLMNEAREMGDLSENQAYADAMERKEMNESRIEELEYKISVAQIIQKDDSDTVGIGDTVDIERVDNLSKRTLTLVGREFSGEADPRLGKISIDSPLGIALNGSKVGDVVKAKLPTGEVQYKIKKIAA